MILTPKEPALTSWFFCHIKLPQLGYGSHELLTFLFFKQSMSFSRPVNTITNSLVLATP
jgi:hypothetical protein